MTRDIFKEVQGLLSKHPDVMEKLLVAFSNMALGVEYSRVLDSRGEITVTHDSKTLVVTAPVLLYREQGEALRGIRSNDERIREFGEVAHLLVALANRALEETPAVADADSTVVVLHTLTVLVTPARGETQATSVKSIAPFDPFA